MHKHIYIHIYLKINHLYIYICIFMHVYIYIYIWINIYMLLTLANKTEPWYPHAHSLPPIFDTFKKTVRKCISMRDASCTVSKLSRSCTKWDQILDRWISSFNYRQLRYQWGELLVERIVSRFDSAFVVPKRLRQKIGKETDIFKTMFSWWVYIAIAHTEGLLWFDEWLFHQKRDACVRVFGGSLGHLCRRPKTNWENFDLVLT